MRRKSKKRKAKSKNIFFILCISFYLLLATGDCWGQNSSEYVKKAWALKGEGKIEEVYATTDECIAKLGLEADSLAKTLTDFPSKGEEGNFGVMNDVATCYFIKGEALRDEGKPEEAKQVLSEVVQRYPYAQAFDPRGWYWSIKEKSEIIIAQIEGRVYEPPHRIEEEVKVSLHDEGGEFPVRYAKYGQFVGVGTQEYRYVMKDPIGLAKAVGEGIYPNSTSLKFDPEFIKIKKKLPKINHWDIASSRDLSTAFYKWCLAPEPQGVKQFFIADILERSGLTKQAVKAYYALLVHFPKSYGWTYWHTPWYTGTAALYRLKHILKENPQLGLKLQDASIEVINGYDNNIRNDRFVVNPGKLTKMSFWEKFWATKRLCQKKKVSLRKILETRGGEKVKLIKYGSGDWQLMVDNKPFLIKGLTYTPTRVGESPDKGTLQNWTTQDINKNGLIDGPYDTWVDSNNNNIQDENEKVVGDFQLMKDMGVNAIRLYHQPFQLNKELLRKMYGEYGIYVILGDFLGKYALGSGASWQEGTDYNNSLHKENMLNSVRQMVSEFKDEPYVLIWLLGNENVYGVACNADKQPESFFTFVNEAARLIKSLDPQKRPVAIASGDTLYLDIFAQHCPDVDIFGANMYR
ncbi:MAG: hypothetical protein JSW40_07880, partial [Candidatus Omnitrophota bacterium]